MPEIVNASPDVVPHPDGLPHRKACGVCAFRRANPQELTDDDFDALYLDRDLYGAEFYCGHRLVDGFQRVCACWAAIEKGREMAREREAN